MNILNTSSDDESNVDSTCSCSRDNLIQLEQAELALVKVTVIGDTNTTTSIVPTLTVAIPIVNIPVQFELFFMKDENIRTVNRSWYLLAACIGVVKNFSLDVIPYKDMKNPILPTQVMLRQEILRRSLGHLIRKMKNAVLVDLLNSEELMIDSEVYKEYIISNEK